MQYFEMFSIEARERTKILIAQRNTLTKTIDIASKNLIREKEVCFTLQERIDKLNDLSTESLTDDVSSFAKFKTSLKKLSADLVTAEDACRALTDKAIPQKKKELSAISSTLKRVLQSYFIECKPINDENVRSLIDKADQEQQDYYEAFEQIFKTAGLTFQTLSQRGRARNLGQAYRAFTVTPKRPKTVFNEPKATAVQPDVSLEVKEPETEEEISWVTKEPAVRDVAAEAKEAKQVISDVAGSTVLTGNVNNQEND